MMRTLISLIIACCLHTQLFAQQENIISVTLEKLIESLDKNNFQQTDNLLATLISTSGHTELAARISIINAIIQKESVKNQFIDNYINSGQDQTLINRFDHAVQKDFQKYYDKHQKEFDYFPLNHPVDSILKVKASALLQSENYVLTDKEVAILYLFSDNIEAYLHERYNRSPKKPKLDEYKEIQANKTDFTFGIHVGTFLPLKKDGYIKNSPIIGLSVLSPLNRHFVYEFQYKFRINNSAAPFVFQDSEDVSREIEAGSAHNVSVGFGYKAFENDKFIIIPKLNVGVGFLWTGVTETTYEVDDYGDEYESVNYKNINTLHSAVGISFMRHLKRKLYIGLETNYHYVPYQWDNKLKSPIQSNYASLEIFFRF